VPLQWTDEREEVVKVDPDEIILIWDGFYSGEAFIGFHGVLPSTAVKISPASPAVDKGFLFYFFKSRFKELNSKVAGMYLKHVSKFVFESLGVPLPSLPEQKKIATILSTVDDAIQKTDEIIAKTERLKKGLMQKLLTSGIGHTRFKQTEMGEIPEEWDMTEIESICDILDSQRIPLNEEVRRTMKGEIPYYGANGLVDYVNDYIFEGKLILVAEDGGYFDEYTTRPIAYLVNGKCWVNNHAHVLKVREGDGYSTEYIFYSLEHRNLMPFIKGSTRTKLNQKELREIPIPIPPLPEQKKIASILSTVDEQIEKERAKKGQLEQLKKGLMQVLLTGKVRVKVN
jgi:type I restriction enzyme S subunit